MGRPRRKAGTASIAMKSCAAGYPPGRSASSGHGCAPCRKNTAGGRQFRQPPLVVTARNRSARSRARWTMARPATRTRTEMPATPRPPAARRSPVPSIVMRPMSCAGSAVRARGDLDVEQLDALPAAHRLPGCSVGCTWPARHRVRAGPRVPATATSSTPVNCMTAQTSASPVRRVGRASRPVSPFGLLRSSSAAAPGERGAPGPVAFLCVTTSDGVRAVEHGTASPLVRDVEATFGA